MIRRAVICAAAAMAIFSAFTTFYFSVVRDKLGEDFPIFYWASSAPIPGIYLGSPDGPFVNPPSSIPWFRLLSAFPEQWAYPLFMALSIALFAWSACRTYPVAAVALALIAPPVISAVANGQTTLLLGSAVLLAFSLPSIPRGAILACVISAKPQMAFIAPLILWNDRKAFLSLMGTGFALLLANLAVYGIQPWLDWLGSFEMWRAGIEKFNVQSMTLAGYAERLGLIVWPFWLVGFITACWAAIIKPKWIDPPALLVGCSVLASPYSLGHDLVALMPWAASLLLQKPSLKTGVGFYVYLALVFPIVWLATCLGPHKYVERACRDVAAA